MLDAFRMLAHYNRIANERLYEKCAQLDPAEYRRQRQGSFGSIHGLLNHLLLGDRIWMSRFTGGGNTTPPLNSILFDSFARASLRARRTGRGNRSLLRQGWSRFSAQATFLRQQPGQGLRRNSPRRCASFFNHQTHHRGQVHVMISQTDVKPPSLDMHRILNP